MVNIRQCKQAALQRAKTPLKRARGSSTTKCCITDTSLPPTLPAATLPPVTALQKINPHQCPKNTDSISCQAASSMIDGEAKAWHVPSNDAEEAKVPRRKAEERENNHGKEHLRNAAATWQSLSFKASRLHPSSTQLKSQTRYKSTNSRSFGPHSVQGRSPKLPSLTAILGQAAQSSLASSLASQMCQSSARIPGG